MLALAPQLLELLRARRTLVVPTRQRAVALRAAHGAVELAAGKRAWYAPEILPWNSFVARELERGARSSGYHNRVLQPLEEWLLWREAARDATRDHALLRSGDLARGVQRAATLMDAWRIAPGTASDEGALLLEVLRRFRETCRDLKALSAADPGTWPAGAWPQGEQTWLAGIVDTGPAWKERLALSGARELEMSAVVEAARTRVLDCADSTTELALAAAWCRDWLARDPQARLLVVVPHLDRVRSQLLRAFDGELMQGAVLSGSGNAGAAYVIEGGVPLTDHGLARHALYLLQLAREGLEFSAFGELLRSDYIGLGERTARCRLELWLRDQQVTHVDASVLRQLQAAIAAKFGGPLAESIEALVHELLAARDLRQDAAQWARYFARCLELAGWPGQPAQAATAADGSGHTLSSDEQQLKLRIDELLGELARLTHTGAWGLSQALQAFGSRLHEIHFEAANSDAAVTISPDSGDPMVRYDAIRVCGLTAERWPAPANAHPLLPVSAQLAAGLPQASAAGQLAGARRALERWQAASGELVLSFSRTEEQVVQEPSPLLAAFGSAEVQSRAPRNSLLAALRAESRLEDYRQAQGSTWSSSESLPSGTRALQLQSECPYHAYAQLRLDADSIVEPAPGIDARLRGTLLHAALEYFWKAVRGHAGLLALSAANAQRLRQEAVHYAMQGQLRRRALPPDPGSVRRELARSDRILAAALEWDLARAPFTVKSLEAGQPLALGQASLDVRIDRIDTLEGGELAVLDYKTGRGSPFAAEEERLSQVQLPAYAVSVGPAVAAVASVHVRADVISVRGVADQPGRIPRLPESPIPWDELQQRWREQLQVLADEFLAGDARVDPQPGACLYCHLTSACRVVRAAPDDAPAVLQAEARAD